MGKHETLDIAYFGGAANRIIYSSRIKLDLSVLSDFNRQKIDDLLEKVKKKEFSFENSVNGDVGVRIILGNSQIAKVSSFHPIPDEISQLYLFMSELRKDTERMR